MEGICSGAATIYIVVRKKNAVFQISNAGFVLAELLCLVMDWSGLGHFLQVVTLRDWAVLKKALGLFQERSSFFFCVLFLPTTVEESDLIQKLISECGEETHGVTEPEDYQGHRFHHCLMVLSSLLLPST